MSIGPLSEKFNIVSSDHGRTQKCDFCVSVDKTNFTDHHTPDTINGFRDSVLFCKMHVCYCTIRKNFQHFHSFSSGLLIKQCKRQAIAIVRLYLWKQTISKCFWTYLALHIFIQIVEYIDYSIAKKLKNNWSNICSKMSKAGINLWMV